jgi:hypothetical protein
MEQQQTNITNNNVTFKTVATLEHIKWMENNETDQYEEIEEIEEIENSNINEQFDHQHYSLDDIRRYNINIAQLIHPLTFVYLGSYDVAGNKTWLMNHGITHILTVGNNMKPLFPGNKYIEIYK